MVRPGCAAVAYVAVVALLHPAAAQSQQSAQSTDLPAAAGVHASTEDPEEGALRQEPALAQQRSQSRLIRTERSRSHAVLNVDDKGRLIWVDAAGAASQDAPPGNAALLPAPAAAERAEVQLTAMPGTVAVKEHTAAVGQPALVQGSVGSTDAREFGPAVALGVVDMKQGVSISSVLAIESRLFAENVISQERAKVCPDKLSDVKLQVLAAQVQMSADIIVTLKVQLPGGASLDVKVEWTPDAHNEGVDSQVALARVEAQMFSNGGFAGLLNRGAKLVLPKAACELLDKGAALEDGSISEAASDAEEEVQALRRLHLEPVPPLGLIVDRELEAYQQGLASQAAASSQSDNQQAMGQLPDSFTWRTASPACLDYVHNQGDCGACFMFAALDSLSDRLCINLKGASTLGQVDHLSIQMALLCEPDGRQCSGGWADIGFNFSKYNGVGVGSRWPYERKCLSDSACSFGSQCAPPPGTQACFEFFSAAELEEITTYEDANRVTRKKCKATANADQCQVWADSLFGASPSQVFLAKPAFCKSLLTGFSAFKANPAPGGAVPASLLEEESFLETEAEQGLELEEGDEAGLQVHSKQRRTRTRWWGWFSRRRDSESGSATTTTAPPMSMNRITTKAPSTTMGQSLTALCDRNRCSSEPAPHRVIGYNYLLNTKVAFKTELYNAGPFYTSFYIYEDFTWFFNLWPTEAYNLQWGQSMGGHATVIIGWQSGCTYHNGASLLQEELIREKKVLKSHRQLEGTALLQQGSGLAASRRYNLGESRRRTATSDCWHLRNTWGPDWGDSGYFRLKDDMLTGPTGTNLHIASAAGQKPYSTR